jgi:hypothetical protein
METVVVVLVGCGIVSSLIASGKGRDPIGFLIAGCAFGIFGVAAAALTAPGKRSA